jgi:uncharacterized protein (UPF0335 family)
VEDPLTLTRFEKQMSNLSAQNNRDSKGINEHLHLIESKQLSQILEFLGRLEQPLRVIEASMEKFQENERRMGFEVSDLKGLIEAARSR